MNSMKNQQTILSRPFQHQFIFIKPIDVFRKIISLFRRQKVKRVYVLPKLEGALNFPKPPHDIVTSLNELNKSVEMWRKNESQSAHQKQKAQKALSRQLQKLIEQDKYIYSAGFNIKKD